MKLIVWIFVLAVSAHAQLSGTVIVFQLEPSGFFSAADSRAVLADGIPPEDSHCKIAALDRGVVFAVSGGYKYPPVLSDPVHPWSSIDEARIAVAAARNTGNIVTHMNAIADMWAANMKHNWEVVNKFHPEKVRDTANYGHGFLTYGIFAIGRNGILDVVARKVSLATDGITSEIEIITCTIGHPCAAGQTDVFTEFMARKTTRSKGPDGELPTQPGPKVIRLVDLTIAYDTSGYVGGAVDALKLGPDGSVTWFQRKPNCPEHTN